MSSLFSTLLRSLDSEVDTVARWQREMTARPALGPENRGEGEDSKAAWLTEELVRLGIADVRQYPCPDARVPSGFRPNVVARVPGKSARTLWVIGHMDVVPPGDSALWDSPSDELRVEGDLIFGRGVEDNQQAIVTAMLAAKVLLERGVVPDLSLGLLFVADEETGMAYGLPHVLAEAPELIRPDDLVLVPDMGNHEGSLVEIAEKSCLWLRFTVTGKQCHASTPDQGVNSLVAASACVLALQDLSGVFSRSDPLYQPPCSTFVPSKKEANVENVNTLPGRDVFYLDCRVLPEYPLDEVEAECRRLAESVAAVYGAHIEVEAAHREQAPPATPQDAPVVRRLLAALRELRGTEGRLCGVGGQTVAAPLRARGLAAVVWATLMPNAHAPNECSRLSATVADAKIVMRMLFDGI